ncbi:hypothetical protein GCM10009839_07170 [Catenulispora yoronensis]|uniref:Uncharacterized protein n=1 Tax=Catenulispora yoronensis TaxID=450799 RepID=A0ABN2TN64_9ACTN
MADVADVESVADKTDADADAVAGAATASAPPTTIAAPNATKRGRTVLNVRIRVDKASPGTSWGHGTRAGR